MLSYFVLKVESYDAEVFVRRVAAADPNGVILVWTYAGEIQVAHKPAHIRLRPAYRFYTPGRWTQSRWIKWPAFIWQSTRLLVTTLRQERVDRFVLEGGDIGFWIAQFLKKLGLIKRTYIFIFDWASFKPTDDLYDKINITKTLVNDFLITRMKTTVIVTTKRIYDIRNSYWKNATLRNSVLIDNYWARLLENKRRAPRQDAKKILYLGNMRRHFCMEKIFDLLPDLHREFGMSLKVIGPEIPLYHEYMKLAEARGLGPLIEWRGFVALERFDEEFADCFCGVNTQEFDQNNNTNAIAGRVVNFIQYLLVPVVTPESGPIVPFLREYKLGPLCEPTHEGLRQAFLDAKANEAAYVERMEAFLARNPYARDFNEVFR